MGWAAASVFVGIRVSLSVREGQGSCTCVSDGRLSYLLACSARGEDKAFGVCRCRTAADVFRCFCLDSCFA